MRRRSAIVAAACVALAGAIAFAGVALRTKHRRAHPPGSGAYIAGGVPMYDPDLERALPELLESARENGHGSLRERARALSDGFAARGLGYYVRPEPHGLYAYRVERVEFVRVAGEPRRILELRALDRSKTQRVLGMQAEDLGDAVVMLDQIDDFVANRIGPVLAGADYPHLGRATGPTGAAAAAAIRRELAGRDVAQVTRALAASVGRHEARHDYDEDLDTPLREPLPLITLVGAEEKDPFVIRSRAELAAYLSQIANDPIAPQLALWNVASLATHKGSAESVVATVIVSGLVRRSGVPASELASLGDEPLRTAARGLWQDLYGEPYAPVLP